MQSFLTRNLVALGYDSDWESKNRGPFKSTAGLTKAAGIRADDFVLEVGCGTGVVSREVARRLASFGLVIGFDFSWGALSIAKSSVPSGDFVEMDAENIEMHAKFDRTVRQYTLMFFTELAKTLVQLRALLNEEAEAGWQLQRMERHRACPTLGSQWSLCCTTYRTSSPLELQTSTALATLTTWKE